MGSKIVEAINNDCTKLIKNFASHNNTDFSSFSQEYENMQFYNIYAIQVNDADMILTTRHIFKCCKEVFNNRKISTVIEKVGAIYLMYHIYYQQPQKRYVKISVDMKTYTALRKFVETFDEKQSLDQARYIFYHLLSVNAFRFVVSEIFYGLEHFLNKKDDFTNTGESENDIKNSFLNPEMCNLRDKEKGLLSAFKLLETKYNTCKMEMNEKEQIETNRIEATNVIEEYETDLQEIAKILHVDSKESIRSVNSKHSMALREIKQTAFSKNVDSFNKSILDATSTDDSSSCSEKAPNDDPEPIKQKKLRGKYCAMNAFLNEPLPMEVSKELGDC